MLEARAIKVSIHIIITFGITLYSSTPEFLFVSRKYIFSHISEITFVDFRRSFKTKFEYQHS